MVNNAPTYNQTNYSTNNNFMPNTTINHPVQMLNSQSTDLLNKQQTVNNQTNSLMNQDIDKLNKIENNLISNQLVPNINNKPTYINQSSYQNNQQQQQQRRLIQ